jgi:hypothetical protein
MIAPEQLKTHVDKLSTENEYADLVTAYKSLNTKRKEIDKVSKGYKELETKVETLLLNKLTQANIKSVKTPMGTVSVINKTAIKNSDRQSFIDWLWQDQNRSHLLLATPYSSSKIKEEYEDELPPGLTTIEFLALSVRSK